MENFLAIVFVIGIFTFGIWGPMIFGAGTRTVKAATKTATGKGSFSENMDLEFKGMGKFKARLVDGKLGDKEGSPDIKAVEVKGLFPVSVKRNVAFVISVFDLTDGDEKRKPILSSVDVFQEPESVVYQQISEIGEMSPNYGYPNWARVGGVILEIMQPPIGGKRIFEVFVRLVDLDKMPNINHGFIDQNGPKSLWLSTLKFEYTVDVKGYEEEIEHRDHGRALSVKIGMAVAMADGFLHDDEGEALKAFVRKCIEPFSEEKKSRLKDIYNDAMKVAHAEAKTGDLIIGDLTAELNEIADRSSKYETIELCFDVMAADGVADAEELKIIRKISDSLGLDYEEIENMRDKKLIGLTTNLGEQANIEDILGIEGNWDKTKIKQHLLTEFQKWNNRINTLSEGDERTNAQQMLDLIGQARKKYE
jgi:uncharacterized tellurite resistance protein B-like protein